MDRLIGITNQIQDALAEVKLELDSKLPQICVVGGQSAGKSSLLEGLVGHAFLPTGTGVVTRRPLVLRLNKVRGGDVKGVQEWAEFSHAPGQRFEDFKDVRDEIAADTSRICGSLQKISHEPIILSIFSPNVIDLTLVDLPGITRVPVGDQPPDIEKQIRQLVMSYVSDTSCLILAVVAGNQDLATADALAIAREVDPAGERTIGVVTKLDLVEHGTDLLPVLEGRIYNLQQGFVGVVCRSFRDVQKGKSMKDHLAAEAQYFRGHAAYRGMAQRCGILYLSKHLNRILMDHISEAMPDVINQVRHLIHENEFELQAYGESISLQRGDMGALILGLLTKFAGRFGDAIEGKLSGQQDSAGQLVGRARIDFIFRDVFVRTVRDFDSCNGLSDDEIRVAIRNATGPRATLFVPEAAFEVLVRKQISKLQAPSLQCAELVFDELQRVLLLSDLPEFRRFCNLRDQTFSVVRGILVRCLEPTVQMIKDLISIELAYINTNHPDFVGSSGAMRAASAPPAKNQANPVDRSGNGIAPAPAASEMTTPLQQSREVAGGALEPAPAGAASGAGGGGGGGGFFSFFRNQSRSQLAGSFSERTTDAVASAESGAMRRDSKPQTNQNAQGTATQAGHQRNSYSQPPEALQRKSVGGYAAAPSSGGFGTSGVAGGFASHGVLKLPHIAPVITPASQAPTQRERVEVGIIKMLLDSYLSLVKKNIADSIPKAVMHFMVNNVKDVIQSECVARLYKEEHFDELLSEARDVKGRRSKCRERLAALHKVIEVSERMHDGADLW